MIDTDDMAVEKYIKLSDIDLIAHNGAVAQQMLDNPELLDRLEIWNNFKCLWETTSRIRNVDKRLYRIKPEIKQRYLLINTDNMTNKRYYSLTLWQTIAHNNTIKEQLIGNPELSNRLEYWCTGQQKWIKCNEVDVGSSIHRIKPEIKQRYKPYTEFQKWMWGTDNWVKCTRTGSNYIARIEAMQPESEELGNMVYILGGWFTLKELYYEFKRYNPTTGETSPCGEEA